MKELVSTPSLVIDVDAMNRNLEKMSKVMGGVSPSFRPHAKAHKSPFIAKLQVDSGAVGICCSKLEEAERMVAAGVLDILITTPVVGYGKARRLAHLLKQNAALTIVLDDVTAAIEISNMMVQTDQSIDCLIDVNLGQERTGVDPARATRLAEEIRRLPSLRLRGIQAYEGHLQGIISTAQRADKSARAMKVLGELCEEFTSMGLSTEVVTTAGTGTFRQAVTQPFVTEVQPGSYVFMDHKYASLEDNIFECSLSVICSVISVQRSTSVIVDAGFKALSVDAGSAVTKSGEGVYEPAGDEHGKITYSNAADVPALGAQIELIPSHCDTTVNLFDDFTLVRGTQVVGKLPIWARGALQ